MLAIGEWLDRFLYHPYQAGDGGNSRQLLFHFQEREIELQIQRDSRQPDHRQVLIVWFGNLLNQKISYNVKNALTWLCPRLVK